MLIKIKNMKLKVPLEELIDPVAEAIYAKMKKDTLPLYTHLFLRTPVKNYEAITKQIPSDLSYDKGINLLERFQLNLSSSNADLTLKGNEQHASYPRASPLLDLENLEYPTIIGMHVLFRRALSIPEFLKHPEIISNNHLRILETSFGKCLIVEGTPPKVLDGERRRFNSTCFGEYSEDSSDPLKVKKILYPG